MDGQYRTAMMPSLLSVCAFVLSAWLVYRISFRMTNSPAAGFFAGVILLSNGNLQYLQSCPLTEPIYIALMLAALDSLIIWREREGRALPWAPAAWSALGALCRYEAWYFVAGILLLLAWDFWRRHRPRVETARGALMFVAAFCLPVGAHFAYIYSRIGDSFIHRVVRGKAGPYETFKHPLLSLIYHLGEVAQAAAILPLLVAFVGVLYCLSRCRPFSRWAPLLLLWTPSLVNISALYWGLIYRVRYSSLLIPAVAVFASLVLQSASLPRFALIASTLAVMVLPWLSWYFPPEWVYRFFLPGPGLTGLPVVALLAFLIARAAGSYRWPLLLLAVLGVQMPALEGENRPILAETLEHQFLEGERQRVLLFLRENYDGTRLLIDMGKLAPLVYDSGIPVRGFVHSEGDRVLWEKARGAPHHEVGWILAGKDDAIWIALQVDPHWADRYSLALKTDNYRIYRLGPADRDGLFK